MPDIELTPEVRRLMREVKNELRMETTLSKTEKGRAILARLKKSLDDKKKTWSKEKKDMYELVKANLVSDPGGGNNPSSPV